MPSLHPGDVIKLKELACAGALPEGGKCFPNRSGGGFQSEGALHLSVLCLIAVLHNGE